ncbi:Transposase IS66 family protein [Martelella mediterranea DSM 17316]|uniref:Transposase IS66 family protein n=1 Tax=Martelella mediterranea DSM 17316 TaxID=1122214 RepID=A0A1U9Z1T0_9HYPH|nr:Transposase IS66 family protein [Martelella mediterranea DSM 17316]
MGTLGFELEILAANILAEIKKAERVFVDETTLPTLAPGLGATKTAWLWAYARDDRPFGGSGPPMVVYRFGDTRAGECVARHLNARWGDLPEDCFGPYQTVKRRYYRWIEQGVFDRIFEAVATNPDTEWLAIRSSNWSVMSRAGVSRINPLAAFPKRFSS